MPDFVIKTQFRGADKISPILKKMGIRVKQVGDQASRSFRKASKSAGVFGGVVKGILAAGLIRRGFMLAGQAVRTLGQEFLDFDANITKAVTRLPGGLGRGSDAFKTFGKIARREAERTEFTAGQTAAAVEQLALAGFNLKQSAAALPGTINLATNATIEVAQATTIAAKTLGAFGLKVDDTAQLTTNLTRVNDVFSKTVSSATLDIEGLFETLKFGGPAAFAAGQSLETFSAITGTLADQAIDASVAGTSLRRAFINLALPKTTKAMKKLGVAVKDEATGNFRDFLDIMGDIGVATASMGNKQKLATLSTIFGARAVNAMSGILVKGVDNVKDFRTELENSTGASKKMADTIRKSLTNRLLKLKSAAIELGFKFIEAFNKNAGGSLDAFTRKIRKFDIKPVIQGVKDAIKFTKDLAAVVRPFADFLPVIIGLWASYRVALVAVTVIQAAQFFVKLAGAIKVTTGSMAALKVAMIATAAPVALMTVAITGLVAALAIVIVKNDEVVSGWEEGFASMHIAAIKFWIFLKQSALSAINSVIDLISFLPKQVAKIFGVDLGKVIPKVEFDFADDFRKIKEIQRIQKDIATEGAGLGTQRGAAGIRGFRAPTAPPTGVSGATFAQGQGRQTAEQAIEKLFQGQLRAPNRSEVEAQRLSFEGRMSFVNAPPGATFESTTKGGPPIAVEGLGQQ